MRQQRKLVTESTATSRPSNPTADQLQTLRRRLQSQYTNNELKDIGNTAGGIGRVLAGWDPAWQNTWRDITWGEFWDWFFVVLEDIHENPMTGEA